MSNQRQSRFSDSGDSPTSMVVLFGRNKQMIHLLGYELKSFPNITLANTDGSRARMDLILAADPDLPLGGGGGGTLGPVADRQGVIDWFRWDIKTLFTTSGGSLMDLQWTSGWHPCDLIVPALYVHKTQERSGHTIDDHNWGVTLEYRWITLSDSSRAAYNLMWGRDIMDSDDEASHAPARIP